MQGSREREHDAVRDLVRRHGVEPLVHRVGLLAVAAEPDERELGLDEAGVDGGDPDGAAEEILAERVREAAHRKLRRDVGRPVRVGLAPGDRAHEQNVPAVADVRQA